MFRSRKLRKKDVDRQLLNDIYQSKEEWRSIKSIIEKSVEPTERGRFDLAVAEVKYFYLLREARQRKVSAR
ncbi:YaaL family protein [Sediminibacillus massiliensis]|uniref:YaaL family protein n=1 Tax=Sediminibacillus massiliensis TaxID=1926277 RepID=UPI001FE7C9B2|nr:YaaL family protein [Sediminibacillus massiliensis]